MSKGTITNLRPGFVTFELKGLDEYAETIAKVGLNIDDIVGKALELAAEPIHAALYTWAARHRLTGAVMSGVIPIGVLQSGNEIYVELGITGEGESWHAVFTEYGSPHNIPADPGVRMAFEKHKGAVGKIIREYLKDAGVMASG